MRTSLLAVACLAMVVFVPGAARADGYVSPLIGANFGGSVGTPLNVAARNRSRAAYGAQFGGMGGGIFGAEVDFSYTPNFFTENEGAVTSNNLLAIVPALIVGIPIGGQKGAGVRPYFTAGLGMIRRDFEFQSLDSLSKSQLAYSLGGGVMGYFTDHFGLRGDLRYFRNFEVDDFGLSNIDFERGTFNFGRASVGAVFRF